MYFITLIPKEDLQLTINSYEPPTIEIIEITVEKGFADSAASWKDGGNL